MKYYQKLLLIFLQNTLQQTSYSSPEVKIATPKIHAQNPELNDLLESLTAIDAKIAFQRKKIINKTLKKKKFEDKNRDKLLSQNILNENIDTSYLTNKLQKIAEVPIGKDLIRTEMVQVKQYFILMTEISVNMVLMAVYKRRIEFYDLGGNFQKKFNLNYEIKDFKESQGADGKKSLDIFTSDLRIYSFNLVSHAYQEKKRQTQLQAIHEKQFNKMTLDLKLVLRFTIDVLKALDLGIVPFTYFTNRSQQIDFTSMESIILRKTRQIIQGDSKGNVYHLGQDEKQKGKLSLEKISSQSYEPILDSYSITPFNSVVTPNGLFLFTPFQMTKTIDCREDTNDPIVATTVSMQQQNMHLYFLITAKGVVYVKYIKSGSCLTAAKLLLKSKNIHLPKILIIKNMIVIIPDSRQSNDVEIYDIKNILRLKQSSPYGLQANIPDFVKISDDTKLYKFRETSLLVTQIHDSKSYIYILGIKLDEDSSQANWKKMPWVLIMFGIAIIYNLVFRKVSGKDTTYIKKQKR